MSTDTSPGQQFRITMGEVTNCKDDPTQSRQCRVKLQSGAGQGTDQIDSDKLPWYPIMNDSSNPALKGGVGGSLQSLKVGSRVVCCHIGDQDVFILGSVTASGNGQPDTKPQFNSALPSGAKVQDNGGESQSDYGDKAIQMQAEDTQDSPQQPTDQQDPIWKLAEDKLGKGQQGNDSLYAGLKKDVVANVPAMNAGGFGTTAS
jgi:hypothetical protein